MRKGYEMMKRRTKRLLSLLVAAALTLGLLPGMAMAAEETVLVKWADTLVTDATNGTGKMPIPIPAVDGTMKDGAELTRGGAGTPTGDTPAVNSTKSNQTVWFNNWTPDDSYWQLTFSTKGITQDTLVLRAGQYSTASGPKHFQAKYSTDGVTFTAVGDAYALGTSKVTAPALNITLPNALLDQDTVYIRLYPTDGTAGASNNSRIHDIYVVNAPAATKVETPTAAAPVNGGTVVQGATVIFSCSTENVIYSVSTDYTADNDDTNDTWTPLEGNVYTLDTAGEVSLFVKAHDTTGALDDSDVAKFTYTVNTPLTPLANNSEVVIFYAKDNLAMTASASGKKLTGVAATMAEDKLTTTETAAVFTATLTEDNFYYLVTGGKYLTTGATGNSLSLVDAADDYSLWTLETASGDGYLIRNVNANSGNKAQYVEYYSGFTTYGMGKDESIYTFQFVSKDNVTTDGGENPPTPPDPPEPGKTFYKPADGDVVVMYQPNSGMALTATTSGTRLKGVAATAAGNALVVDGSELRLTASVDADGKYTFTAPDGKVLDTSATGNSLTLVEAGSATAAKWALESLDNGWLVKNTVANYNGNYNQCIEVYSGNFTTYGYKGTDADKNIFTMQFFKDLVIPAAVDADVEEAVASWGGGSQLEDTVRAIKGDLFQTGDMKDDNAAFTAVVSGAAVQPFTTSNPSTGGTSYYMGGKGLGSGSDDYLQLAASAAGWGKLSLSFRLRASNSGPGTFQLQYSTNGADFVNFTNGSYEYGYNTYEGGVLVDSGTRSGKITDGVAKTSLNPGAYVSFTFDVPVGAENADNLLIRLVAGNTKAKGDGAPSATGVVRMDSVVLSGHPILSDDITGYVSVDPDGKEEDQAAGTELTMTSATAGAAIQYRFNGQGAFLTYDATAKPVLPDVLPANLEVYATAAGKAQSVKRVFTYAAGTVATVKMEPNGGGVYIAEAVGSVEVTLSCATEGAVIYYSTTGEAPEDYKEYTGPIALAKGFGSMTVRAYAVKTGFSDSALATRTFTERENADYQLYFGQIHSHTNYSDGAGSCDEAFQHAKGLDEAWNIDFLAVTDHSNSFDNADSASIADGSMSSEWVEGHELADTHSDDTFVGIYGYEMTWSNGLGHMNTFNTPGFQSRTQADYSTYGTALQNYYATLKTQPGSINQFNHPGTTFGDFSDFAHYDEELDALITTIEVGNGEGAIGSSGYFPSYEYYTRALDKGWHVAPTNNQDNHKGHWGDANTGRTVVLADGLDRESIYDALRNYRTYATEDLNLEILYTLDGSTMGTILDGPSGDAAQIKVALKDPDDTGSATVQVIVNGGLVAAEEKATCNETVTFTVPTTYAYYYIKVIQADGDIAVTAPIWLGKVEAVGVGSMTARNAITVAGEEQTIDLSLYNNESKALEITSIVFTDKATGKVLHTDNTIASVPKLGTAECSFAYTFPTDGQVTVLATVKGRLNGMDKTYTQELKLTVMPAEMVRTVIVDGTHYNDYVTGYYGGNMGNMTTIAAGVGVQVKVIQPGEAITAEMLESCALLVIPAPAKKAGTANAGDYVPSAYDQSFLELVKSYVTSGGKVAVCGLADYQDDKAANSVYQTSVQQNKLLAAIGSTLKINDDEVIDNEHNGGQPFRLYPEKFNKDSQWTKGIVTREDVAEGESYQTYSQYSGCSVDPGQGEALVMGFDTTWGGDSDKDGVDVLEGKSYTYQYNNKDYTLDAVVDMGQVVFLAAEKVGEGTVFAAGGVFLSDFEVKAELDNIWDLPYANRTIYENILKSVREDVPATPIADIRKAELNRMFVAEGYVTSGTTDPNTTFFDSIYIQDATGGITIFPYAQSGLAIGTKVRVIGSTDEYQGDREIQITSLEVLDAEPQIQEPKVLTTEEAADYARNGGWLVKTQGTVSDIIMEGGVVSQFKLTDDSGVAATIFIDGYITNKNGENTVGKRIKVGDAVSAVGLSYLHPEGSSDVSVCVLRVRNCDEIKLLSSGSGGYSEMVPTTRQKEKGITVTNPDGSKTTTKTDKNGTTTVTTVFADGSKQEKITTKSGDKTLTVTDASGETLIKAVLPAAIPTPEEGFTDVPQGHWAEGAVNDMAGLELVKGVNEAQRIFDLTSDITRGSLASILYRFSNGEKGLENPFSDVAGDAWYADAVAWAAKTGVVNGKGNNDFAPNDAISRQELAVMLFRYAKLIGMDVKTQAELTKFSDSADVADWAKEAMTWCVGVGILKGTGADLLNPKGTASRAECVVMLSRFIGLL